MEYLPDYVLIGKRIKERRLALQLTQERLAEAASIGIQHMSKIENGHTKLSLPCLISLANALRTTVDYLLTDNVLISKSDAASESDFILADCSPSEKIIIMQTIMSLKESLRTHRVVKTNCNKW